MRGEEDREDKQKDIAFNYKPRNRQINKLFLAFSKLTKTIDVARNSLSQGNEN